LSIDSLTGFSVAPLRLATWFGLGGAATTGLLLAFAIVAWLSGRTVPGWTSTFVAVAAVGAAQLLCLGVLGEYVGRLYTQLQGRPSYFIAYYSLDDGVNPGNGANPGDRVDLADALSTRPEL
jgi:dolichol-phosphate mannosyltransferase